jgi:tol-pal system protein YbgF
MASEANMQRRAGVLLLPLLVALLAHVPGASGDDTVPDRRAVRVAAKQPSDASLRDTLLDLMQQLESLQRDVRDLRNTVEVQGHELEQLKSRQATLYDDLDRRLRDAERRGTPAAAPAAPGAAATASVPLSVPAGGTPAPRTTTPQQQQDYDAAFSLMRQGLYEKAIKAFRDFVAKYPDSALADNAQYWIAEGNYVLRNYKLALEEFTKVMNAPQSTKAPDALLKVGYVQYELGDFDQARKTLTDVQQRYPGTTVARLAATRLEKMNRTRHQSENSFAGRSGIIIDRPGSFLSSS